MIDVNLTGVWTTTKVATPHIVAGGRGGSIILTSSVGGLRGARHIGHYIAAKHGVIGLMRTLALELGDKRIRVNTLCPTNVGTPMLLNDETYRLFLPDLPNPTKEDFAEVAQTGQILPTPWVEPEDISNMVLFLASDEARYITGTQQRVDAGGYLKWYDYHV
jgi:NAD(P)-dependent dehydrogenase (short-subunit alcohol dehydrogenase family)